MQRTIRITTALPHPPETVWRALTDTVLLGQWFMRNDLVPELGCAFTFRMAPQKGWDGITHCKVTEFDLGKRIAYAYRGEASGEKTLACAGIHSVVADKAAKGIFTELDTVVLFTLEPTCGGTLLRLEQSGYRVLKLVIVSYVMGMGWRKQLRKKLPVTFSSMG